MTLGMFALLFHVVVAVLGVGSIAALPIAARNALGVWARPLLLTVRLSLLLAFSSGVLLDFVAHGAFHEALWFRLAGLLVVGTAICLARAGAALSRGLSGGLAAPLALRRIEGWGFTSVIAVACIVVLMEWKPF